MPMPMPKLDFLSDLVDRIAGSGRRAGAASPQEALSRPPFERLAAACDVLMGRIGEAARVAVAEQALAAYDELTNADKARFFALLRDSYGVDAGAVRAAYAKWDDDPAVANLPALFEAVEPARQTLLRRLNMAPGATIRLVHMRADLIDAIAADATLAPVDFDFAHLLSSWFNRGFLRMERVDWNSSAAVLEKIMGYESVHAMRDWSDLRRRLDPNDRRLYAFFHPATGDEPLIFVEVAIASGVPERIADILEAAPTRAPSQGEAAIFYSINNTLKGLKGVSFGNFLIKQVVADLSRQLPQLKTFVTLSPAPGFAAWLARSTDPKDVALAEKLTKGAWANDPAEAERLRPSVEAAAARYFVRAKSKRGLPQDPVARFHLGNGASAWRLNWPADFAPGARRRAHGLMINYLYEPASIERQHEAYVRDGAVAHGPQLARALEA